MKIRVMSDLHLEFGGIDPQEGDVLVLAGDICTVDDIHKDTPKGKYYKKFFAKCVKNYNKVFYVMGNHEHYHGDWEKDEERLRAQLPEGITLLQNQHELYEGVHFIGATLWTSFNEGDPEEKLRALNEMNDYQVIQVNEYEGRLVPNDVLLAHDESVKYLKDTLPTLEGPVVVVTHHAPSLQSISPEYNTELKYSYASDLEQLIIDNTNVKLWCHGHIHANNDYELNQCRVYSNPRGYNNYNENLGFDLDEELDITPRAVL